MPPPKKRATFSEIVDLFEKTNSSIDILPSSPDYDDSSTTMSETESEDEYSHNQNTSFPGDFMDEDIIDPEQAIGEIAEISVPIIEMVSRLEMRLTRVDPNSSCFSDKDGARVDWEDIRQTSQSLIKSFRCSACKKINTYCDREEPCQTCASKGLAACFFGQDVVDEARSYLARLLIGLRYVVKNLNDSALEEELRNELTKLSLSAAAPKRMTRKLATPSSRYRQLKRKAPISRSDTSKPVHQLMQSDWRVMRTVNGFRMEADKVYSLRDFVTVLSKQFPREDIMEAIQDPAPAPTVEHPKIKASAHDDKDDKKDDVKDFTPTDFSICELDRVSDRIPPRTDYPDRLPLELTSAFFDETERFVVNFHFDNPCCFHLVFKEPLILNDKKEFFKKHVDVEKRTTASSFLLSCMAGAGLKRSVTIHPAPGSIPWSFGDIDRVSQHFIDTARSSLDELWDEPNLHTMQGLIYLTVSGYNQQRSSNIYLALAIRMGYDKQLHLGKTGDWDKNEARITMASLYILDFYNVLLLGGSSLMKEMELNMPAPSWEVLERAGRTPDDGFLRMFLMAVTWITQIQKYIIASLYLVPISKNEYPTEMVDTFDSQLDAFYEDLPHWFKYNPETTHKNASPVLLHTTLAVAGLYHVTRIILHQRFCLPNSGPTNTVPFEPPTFTSDLDEDSSWHDSLIMCRDSAENITKLLEIVAKNNVCYFQSPNYFLAASVFNKLARHPLEKFSKPAKVMAKKTLSFVKQTQDYIHDGGRLKDWVAKSEKEMQWFI